MLRELNTNGTTIILTTHYLEEAEELCDRIGIIQSGKLIALERTKKLIGEGSLQDIFLELTRR
jgi:ABC-2 type transport system ATP-binding protein